MLEACGSGPIGEYDFGPHACDGDAQTPGTVRIRGDVEAIDGQQIHIISRRGEKFTLRMVDDMRSYLLADPKVAQVEEFSLTVSAPFNEMRAHVAGLLQHGSTDRFG